MREVRVALLRCLWRGCCHSVVGCWLAGGGRCCVSVWMCAALTTKHRGSMRLLVCLVVAVTGVVAAQDGINKDLINKKIERKLDISSQLVKVTQKITLENGGPAPVRAFLVTITQVEKDKLSYMNVQVRVRSRCGCHPGRCKE